MLHDTQIVTNKLYTKIFHPPPYERTVCHFKHANSYHIKTVIDIRHYQTVHPHSLTPTHPKKYPPPPPPPPANFTGEETMKKLHKIHKIEENQTLKIQNIEKTENEEDIENLKI